MNCTLPITGLLLIVNIIGAISKIGCRLDTMDGMWQVREFIGGIHGSLDWQSSIDRIIISIGDHALAQFVHKELRYYEGVDVVENNEIDGKDAAWVDIKSIKNGLNRCKIRLLDGWDQLVIKPVVRPSIPEWDRTKIALLVPTKSSGQYNSFLEFLYPTFLESISKGDTNYRYTIYLGHDEDDLIQNATIPGHPNVSIIKQQMPPVKIITLYWNLLFKTAYEDGHDYFYQLNDDVTIASHGWTDAFVTKLQSLDDIGVVAPSDAQWKCHLATQSFVSRKHYDIFGWYFPPEIKDWYSDNWITEVYGPRAHCFPDHGIVNGNTKQRYTACKSPPWREALARDQKKVIAHMLKSKDTL